VESGGGFERRVVDGADGDVVVNRRAERDEKKERWKFHMSIKLEKIDVKDAISNKGYWVSKDAKIGVRKSWKTCS
jgi:hypothetical protein